MMQGGSPTCRSASREREKRLIHRLNISVSRAGLGDGKTMSGITVKDYSSACHGSMWWCTALRRCCFNQRLPVHYGQKEKYLPGAGDLLAQVIGRRAGISVDGVNFRLPSDPTASTCLHPPPPITAASPARLFNFNSADFELLKFLLST